MKNEDVIALANTVGIEFLSHTGIGGRRNTTTCGSIKVDSVRELVEAAMKMEREACAKECEGDAFVEQFIGLNEAVRRIRARSNVELTGGPQLHRGTSG